jgi:hypothetical protein
MSFKPTQAMPFDGPSHPVKIVDDSVSLKAADQSRDVDLVNYINSLYNAGLTDAEFAAFAADGVAYTALAKKQDLDIVSQSAVGDHEGEIQAWVTNQRMMYEAGIVDIRNARTSFPGLDVYYMNQFGKESIRYQSVTPAQPLPRLQPLAPVPQQQEHEPDVNLIAVIFLDGAS